MANTIKEFLKKRKMEAKFKIMGPGHKLNESASSSGRGGASSRNHPVPPSASSSGPRSPPPSETAHLQAALSRLETSQRAQNIDWTAAAIKAQAKKELQKEQEQQAGNPGKAGPSTSEQRPGPSRKKRQSGGGHPMVRGVYFSCELLGPETGTYQQISQNIEEYLHRQLEEDEPALAAVLILHSCNEPERTKVGVDTLTRYLQNIADHPEEDKYRKIRMQNKAFQERVAGLVGALEFLQAAGFEKQELLGPDGQPEDFLVFEGLTDNLPLLMDALTTAEPLRPKLDRNAQLLAPAVAATQLVLPDDFFELTVEEIRREQALRKREAELLSQMRTTNQRLQDQLHDSQPRCYGYTVIRVKLPSDLILQGTFSAFERVEDVEQFVMESLESPGLFTLRGPGGERLEGPSTLTSLRLVPAAVLNLQPNEGSPLPPLHPHLLSRLQTLSPQ